MRIGMFTDSYFPQVSGVSTSIKLLSDQLERMGHEVMIFTTTDPDAVSERGIVRLPSVPFTSFEDRRIAFAGFDRCVKLAKAYHFDIIHTHTEFSLGLGGKYVASRLKIPTVHTYHTMYENYTHYIWNGRLINRNHVRLYSKFFCSQTNGVIAPSKLTHETLTNYGIKVPMRVIPTGVMLPTYHDEYRTQMRDYLGIPENAFVMLSLSRLSKEKSIDEVISSFRQVVKHHPETYLVIVGDGPQREDLEALARGYGLETVLFTGEVPHHQVNRYYQMADLFVNASESESQGLTFLEAISNRLPVVAKENEYLNEIIQCPSLGRLYCVNENLAEVLDHYIQTYKRGEIPPIDQSNLQDISVERFADEVVDFYQHLIDQPDTGRKFLFDLMPRAVKELYYLSQEVLR